MSRSPSTAASSFWRFPAGRRRQRSGRQQSDASPCPPGAVRRFQARGSRQGLLRGGPETQRGPPHGVGGAEKSLGRAVSPLPSAVTRMTAGVWLRPSQVPGEPSGLGSLSGWHRAGSRLVLEPGRNPALRRLPAPPLCGDSPRSTWGNTRSGSDGPGQSRVFCVSPCAGTRARHGHLGMKRPRVYRAHTTREGRGAVCERLSSQGCGAAAEVGVGRGAADHREEDRRRVAGPPVHRVERRRRPWVCAVCSTTFCPTGRPGRKPQLDLRAEQATRRASVIAARALRASTRLLHEGPRRMCTREAVQLPVWRGRGGRRTREGKALGWAVAVRVERWRTES